MQQSAGRFSTTRLFVGALFLYAVIFTFNLNGQTLTLPLHFDFGTGAAEPGYVKVTPATLYNSKPALGSGWDSAAEITAVSRTGSDTLLDDYCTSTEPFSFSIKLPLGSYKATVYIGDLTAAAITSVYGEQRRLFVDRLSTAAGQFATKTFTIYRRDYKYDNITISRTTRELTYEDLDSNLTFIFSGAHPAVCGLDVAKADTSVITLYVCGNSTTVDQPAEPFCSWPQMITRMFTPQVVVADYAESGLTAASFIAQNRLKMISALVKPGDYIFAEFGHNDQKDSTDSINYPSNLKVYRDSARAHGAIPVFVTPTARLAENDSTTSIGGLAQMCRVAAKADSVKLIDLNSMVIALHKSIGTNVQAMYADPTTHFTDYGAFELARCVATGPEGMGAIGLGIAQYLNNDLPVFNPADPDPLNYLTTPTVGILEPGLSSVQKNSSDEGGFSVNIAAHTIRFNPGKTGAVVFSVYSLSGKCLAEKRTVVAQTQGLLTWQELGKLPRGIFLLTMNVNNSIVGKIRLCTLLSQQ
jgi:lysophospholipase L1-like esterase